MFCSSSRSGGGSSSTIRSTAGDTVVTTQDASAALRTSVECVYSRNNRTDATYYNGFGRQYVTIVVALSNVPSVKERTICLAM